MSAGKRTSPPQPTLDELVTRVAVGFMQVSARSLGPALERTLRELVEYFDVDTSFLRRNDFDRDLSVLVAEWPRREHVPDPDPLGEVRFGVDPVFDATRDLAEPYVVRPEPGVDAYQERVQQGAGVCEVSMAMVPLRRDGATIGVLGFVKFGDRPWAAEEINALRAVASMIVQLLARVEAEEQLRHHAHHDDLTGLANRRALLEALEQLLSAGSAEAVEPLALLYLDLDRFKSINDSLGHAAGDRLLTAVADRLRAGTRGDDVVARLAGDEYVVLLVGRSHDEVLATADELLAQVSRPIEIAGHHLTRTASMGIAFACPELVRGEDLLVRADAALRMAKDRGGNRPVAFDRRLHDAVLERAETEILLREAIQGTGLELHYQPEIDLRTGRLVAVEALVRWRHPHRGLLSAGSFIGVAEATGLIVDLGQWVVSEACRQMAAWRVEHPGLRITMRVNLSPAQLTTRNIVGLVGDCLARNRLPGRFICFEITEHAVMQDVEAAVQTLHELRVLGVGLAIDDFGTGFSSMSQLKRLPVDTLKIDQTFVAGLGVDGGDRAIVDASVRLANAFGLDIVAEGVESPAMVHELLGLGCHRAQGYLLCVPSPPAELGPLLRAGDLGDRYRAILAAAPSMPAAPPAGVGQAVSHASPR